MNDVIKKYMEEKKKLTDKINTINTFKPVSMYGRYDEELENTKNRIREIDEIIRKFYDVLAKIHYIDKTRLSLDTINDLKNQINVEKIKLPQDLLEVVNEKLENVQINLLEIGTYDFYADKLSRLKEKIKSSSNDNSKIEFLKKEADYISDILNTYEGLKSCIQNLRRMQAEHDDKNYNAIINLNNYIKDQKNKLPLRMLKELEEYEKESYKAEKLSFPSDNIEPIEKAPSKVNLKTTPIKVVSRKKAKKKFSKGLILAGVAAISVATVCALQALIPSISSAIHSIDVSSLASTMLDNANAWHSASAVDQSVLHSANTSIASTISSITGQTASFDGVSGSWTIGNMDLSSFANNASNAMHQAIAKVAGLSATAAGLFAVGIPTTIKGIKRKKEDSLEYKKYINQVKEVVNYYKYYLSDDYSPLDYFQIKQLYNEIKKSNSLSNMQKAELLDKLYNIYNNSHAAVSTRSNEGGYRR